LPKGRKIVKNKWVYKLKLATNKSVDCYKVRLVVKGFTQKEGVDFKETFSPIMKFDSIKIVISIIVVEDMNITQFDVCTAFLYGEIEEEIHMTQPLGLENIKETGKICRLCMVLYGLQQFSKIWIRKFNLFLT
jgi:hypothetical protein